jgi:hypothetical protein
MNKVIVGCSARDRFSDFSSLGGEVLPSTVEHSKVFGRHDTLLELYRRDSGEKSRSSFSPFVVDHERTQWMALQERSPRTTAVLQRVLSQVAGAKAACEPARASLAEAVWKHAARGSLDETWFTTHAVGVSLANEDRTLNEYLLRYLTEVAQVGNVRSGHTDTFQELFGRSNSLLERSVAELNKKLQGGDRGEQIREEARVITLVSLLADGVGGLAAVHGLNAVLEGIKHTESGAIDLKLLAGLKELLYRINRRGVALGLNSLEQLAIEDQVVTKSAVYQTLNDARPLMLTVCRETLAGFDGAISNSIREDDLVRRSERQVERWLKNVVDGGLLSRLSRIIGVPVPRALFPSLTEAVF